MTYFSTRPSTSGRDWQQTRLQKGLLSKCQKHKGHLGISGNTTAYSFTMEFGERLNSILIYVIIRIFNYFYVDVRLRSVYE